MKVERTFKPWSLKHGTVEFLADEDAVRTAISRIDTCFHQKGECPNHLCCYCPEPALKRLQVTGRLETYFSIYESVKQEGLFSEAVYPTGYRHLRSLLQASSGNTIDRLRVQTGLFMQGAD